MIRRADREAHTWTGSEWIFHVKKNPLPAGPMLSIERSGDADDCVSFEVCEMDLQALEGAVATLRQIRDATYGEVMSAPPAGFVRPFTSQSGYIWDANSAMAADFFRGDDLIHQDATTFQPRGWGRIQHLKDAEEAMDEWEEWAMARVKGCKSAEEIIDRLNEVKS